jgi:chromosome segregation ATPase
VQVSEIKPVSSFLSRARRKDYPNLIASIEGWISQSKSTTEALRKEMFVVAAQIEVLSAQIDTIIENQADAKQDFKEIRKDLSELKVTTAIHTEALSGLKRNLESKMDRTFQIWLTIGSAVVAPIVVGLIFLKFK